MLGINMSCVSQLCLSLGRFEISQMSSLSIQVLEPKIAAFYTPTTQLRVDVDRWILGYDSEPYFDSIQVFTTAESNLFLQRFVSFCQHLNSAIKLSDPRIESIQRSAFHVPLKCLFRILFVKPMICKNKACLPSA